MPKLETEEVQQQPRSNAEQPPSGVPHISQTSTERLQAAVHDQALNVDALVESDATSADALKSSKKTILYLAYGSNLSSVTFRKTRGIVPISQVNVYVPDLELTFDLPGLPYLEPCFAGTQYRQHPPDAEEPAVNGSEKTALLDAHWRRNPIWPKPLVGVVYEVTLSDYARIIATEGGGSSYIDIVVDCHPFPADYDPAKPVPESPATPAFKAHTLLSPRAKKDPSSHTYRRPYYARPSLRYKNLLVTGAQEHNLPAEYRAYLSSFPAYQATGLGQKMGRAIFGMLWGPLLLSLLMLSKLVADDKGRSPPWLAKAHKALFEGVWWSYDTIFVHVFGDGER
ncbi:hypothetical protein VTO42DRAFT_7590 [Malbranchea cinnamomea]